MSDETNNDALWRALLTGADSPIRHDRSRYRRIPGSPRCKTCLVPLGGPVAPLVRLATRRARSQMNPNYCNQCETFVRTHPGGAEIELTMLFADVRGSTTLAETMAPAAFSRLMNRFYASANRVLIDSDALIDKLVGDEVIGLYLPVLEPEHARSAILAARDLLEETGHRDVNGPWLPVGVGVHTGVAYVGAVGSDSTVSDFTALGDAVNVAARLSSLASTGEVLISEDAYADAGLELGDVERRQLQLKGRSEATDVRVLRVRPSETQVEAASARGRSP
jgi:adenylate cyclase